MNKKEIEEKLKLLNIVKEWLRTACWEGNIQSLANLILSFTEPKDKQIAELKKENAELKKQLENRNCSNCRRNNISCPNDGSCHNFSLWQPFKNSELKKRKGKNEVLQTK